MSAPSTSTSGQLAAMLAVPEAAILHALATGVLKGSAQSILNSDGLEWRRVLATSKPRMLATRDYVARYTPAQKLAIASNPNLSVWWLELLSHGGQINLADPVVSGVVWGFAGAGVLTQQEALDVLK